MIVANGCNSSSSEECLRTQVTSQDGMTDSPPGFLQSPMCNGSVNNNYPMGYMNATGCTPRCEQYTSTNSSASRRTAGGLSHSRGGGYTVESQSQLPSVMGHCDSWEDVRYTSIPPSAIGKGSNNNNNNNGIFAGNIRAPIKHQNLIHCVSAPALNSPGARNGQYSVLTDFGNNANTSSFIGDASNTHASITQHLNGLSADFFPLRPSNTRSAAWTPPYGTPTMVANSPHVTFGEPERSRILPLRFKMLPPPVQYDKFHDSITNPSERELAPYYRVMMRWYEHIVNQENTRPRGRSYCPLPPDSLRQLDDVKLRGLTYEDLQEWAEWAKECCEWWDVISRKRGRRGHRGGKTQCNGGVTKTVGTYQRPLADDIGTYTAIPYTEPSDHKSEEACIDEMVETFCNAILLDDATAETE